ncbi:phage portal protein [Aureimonas ureilytica]|uniref:phage portal protein n=1 Tax=Aureimonas ureilytica TaxID=401562 RepID=UPI003CFB09BC
MNTLRKLAIKAASTVIRSLTIREPDNWQSNETRADSGEHVGDNSALGIPTVWACVNLLAGTIASLPVMVYRRNAAGEREPARDHPLYRALHDSPNYDQTAVDFWEFMAASIELWGNAYARVERSGGRVTGLHPVMPAAMAVRRLASGSIEYRWTQDNQQFVETDQTMLHIRGFGGNPLGGLSTLRFGTNTFGLARAAQRAAGATFKNGMRPSVQINFKEWLTPEQRAIAEEALAERYAGAMNAGKPYIGEGGAKVEAISIDPVDAQLLEIMGLSVEEICRMFNVPPHMVGHTAKSTSWGTGLEQQTIGFQRFTLRRRLKRIEQACEKQLLTPQDRAAGVTIEFNLEGLLRADSAGRARFYQQMTAIGAMTINEVRRLENLPPVDGGDVPRMQMQNVPITQIDEDAVRALIGQERE